MEALFEIGDIVRIKPRGHKMIVTFIHTPRGNGIYEAIYQSLKFQNPQCDFFYACKDFKTGKPKGVFCEDVLERVDFHMTNKGKITFNKKIWKPNAKR